MKLTTPRGIRDIPPDEYEAMLEIFDAFREKCRLYGFRLMEPATIEKFEVLALKSGEEIEKEIYAFRDKANRKLGLRFDLTVGLTRYVVSNPQLQKPVKLAAYSVQWRYDEPQRGRYRSFYSWDVEIYGGEQILSAAETIIFTDDLLGSLGLNNYSIKISDRRLVERVLREVFHIDDPLPVMRILDKWGKKDEDELTRMMMDLGVSEEIARDIIDTFFYSQEVPESEEKNELSQLLDILKDAGVDSAEIDLSIVRGLDYYDGIVFEVRPSNETLALVGGGNYSALVKTFGGNFNAFGAAGGVERLLMYINRESRDSRGIYIIPIGGTTPRDALLVAKKLRELGIPADYPLTTRGLTKTIKYAEKHGYRYVLFLGPQELREGIYTLKDLATGEQDKYSIKELAEILTQ